MQRIFLMKSNSTPNPAGWSSSSQVIGRGQVYLVRLDPTLGGEIKKTRPCVVVSPDELNEHLRTVIVAPMDN
jgi:hypothetical protein